MGTEITNEVASRGYRVIMLCMDKEHGTKVRNEVAIRTGNEDMEVRQVNLSSMAQVAAVADGLLAELQQVDLLMNNAGTIQERLTQTEDGLEKTVAVNYMAPWLLTNKLRPLLKRGSRVVCMVSVSSAIGRIHYPHFFSRGRKGGFWRLLVYSNTKYALTLFVLRMARLLKEQGVSVNGADPGVVSTPIIRMNLWFDPLTDLIYRPLIRTPRQGADTAIHLLLDAPQEQTATICHTRKPKKMGSRYTSTEIQDKLWEQTRNRLEKWL